MPAPSRIAAVALPYSPRTGAQGAVASDFLARTLAKALCCLVALTMLPHALSAAGVVDENGVIKDPVDNSAVVTYSARIPTVAPGEPAPGLIVALHGINGNEKQLVGPISQALQEAKRESGYLVLGLKSKGAGWEEVDHEPIRKAVAWAIRVHHVDPRRIFAWGYSHGAIRWGHFAAQAQELFAGAVLWAGTCDRMPEDGSGLAYYVVHGAADPTVPPDNIRAAKDKMRQRGVRVVYREFIGGDHGAPFSKARADWPDHIVWMDALRNAKQAIDAKTAATIEKADAELAKDEKLSGATMKALLPGLAEAAGPAADAMIVSLLGAKAANLRRAAASLCTGRLYGDSVIAALVAMVDDPDREVQSLAIRALALASDLQIAPAEESICAVILTHHSSSLRSASLEALLPALRNQKGTVAFDPPFVKLMDDLGKTANPALQKIFADLRGGAVK